MTAGPTRGVPVPPLRPGEPPIAVLVDFDGTIARTDVSAAVIRASLPPGRGMPWNEDAETSWPEMMADAVADFPRDAAPLLAVAASQPLDCSFTALASLAQAAGVALEVVSDGFGFFIEPALRRLGAAWVPIASGATAFGGSRPTIEFPFGNTDCLVCGTCKRNRVWAHQATGRRVVFVGDGESDRFAGELTGDPAAMASALVKLSKENLSNLHPHPLYAAFYYSHPPVVERIRNLKK